jgi:DNA uptake protein ComE-like DNA-binding protein
MWKDFFFFPLSQRIGIVVIICLIVLCSIVNFCIPFFSEDDFQTHPDDIAAFETFKQSLVSLDSVRNRKKHQTYSRSDKSVYKKSFGQSASEVHLFAFDPNTLDSAGFVALGLKPYVISNILKYRRKGGQFRDSEAFGKVYGLTEEQFADLAPYIQIPKADALHLEEEPEYAATLKPTVKVVVELNTADTTQLMQVKGIGRGYARSIVRFRQQTGGFTSVEQLREIYGMTAENYRCIAPHCIVDPVSIRKIKVNTASIERLRSHPYLNFYQAKQIYELRRKKGRLTSFQDIEKLSEMNDSVLMKIRPYLSFE